MCDNDTLQLLCAPMHWVNVSSLHSKALDGVKIMSDWTCGIITFSFLPKLFSPFCQRVTTRHRLLGLAPIILIVLCSICGDYFTSGLTMIYI